MEFNKFYRSRQNKSDIKKSIYSYYSYDSDKSVESNALFPSIYFNGKEIEGSLNESLYHPITMKTVCDFNWNDESINL